MMPYGGSGLGRSVSDWESLLLQVKSAMEELVDRMYKPARIWEKNGIAALVDETLPGRVIDGGTLTKEEALMYSAGFQQLLVWLDIPIPVGQLTTGEVVNKTLRDILDYRRSV